MADVQLFAHSGDHGAVVVARPPAMVQRHPSGAEVGAQVLDMYA